MAENKRVQVKIGKEHFKTEVIFEKHVLIADEPISIGGGDLGPTPGELFLSSLGTCAAITIRMYADRKAWDLQSVHIDLNLESKEDEQGEYTLVTECIRLEGKLDEKQTTRLLNIATKCPIARVVKGRVITKSELVSK
ncbi:MAG: OsmC family protein [Bacteroidota bacterium]